MNNESPNLFPEKDLIDMKFMELVQYTELEIDSKPDIDKALHEYSLLMKKRKEISDLRVKLIDEVGMKLAGPEAAILSAMSSIKSNIERYYTTNGIDAKFEDLGNGTQVAIIEFDHGEVKLTKESKLKMEIKKIKN